MVTNGEDYRVASPLSQKLTSFKRFQVFFNFYKTSVNQILWIFSFAESF